MSKKLVVIGAGMASGRVLEHLLEADKEAYDVTLFNAEPRGNYNRIMLSPVLSGEKTYEEIGFPGGHVGVFVSRKAQGVVACGIVDWIKRTQMQKPKKKSTK